MSRIEIDQQYAAEITAATEAIHRLENLVGADVRLPLWRRRIVVGRLQRQSTSLFRLFHRVGG